jgi:2,4-dienoyl-CoA reductase-like NADH-dependent reductase (Old Yellow Enzyme family)
MNKRQDEYGGNELNRFRIVKNIIEKVKRIKKLDNLAARLTADDFHEDGLNLKKIKNLIKYLDENNFCYYSVTAGIYETAKQKYIRMKEGTYWEYSGKLKTMTRTPVIAQGNITSLKEGEKILTKKQGDMFGMAQSLIADPEIVSKSLNNKEDEVYNCLAHVKVGSCHRCRYIKRKDHDFDCVTPSAWRPIDSTKIERQKDLDFWKQTIEALKKLEINK